MLPLTLDEIADLTDGSVLDAAGSRVVSSAAFVDSRCVVPGGLFVAIPGEHVDGHDFAAAAVAAGAAAALTARPVGAPAVAVADPVLALGRIAAHVRRRLDALTVVGITGSQGKTGTKDLVAAMLETAGPTVSPDGSMNNEIGVPLTALRSDDTTRFLVSEMGARGPGHIAYLCSIVRPQVAVELNVGVAHLGEFGDRDAIARAKAELVASLPSDGVAVLNVDDPRVAAMGAGIEPRVVGFGSSATAEVRFTDVRMDGAGRTSFQLTVGDRSARVGLQLVGEHQPANAAAAAATAYAVGVPFDRIIESLSTARPRSHWRMEVTTAHRGYTVINDAYNANPDSMRSALHTLVRWERPAGGRTVAVLGGMRELGASTDDEHRAVGALVAGLGIDVLVVVGDDARQIVDGAHARSAASTVIWVSDATSASRVLDDELRAGDVVLVKASRAAGLDRVATALGAASGEQDSADHGAAR
jgi:UDP-N-acetylmuramoyl-tripeptide--D-alanyl-D-alanine ligase